MLSVRTPPISILPALAAETETATVTSTTTKDRANMDSPSQIRNAHSLNSRILCWQVPLARHLAGILLANGNEATQLDLSIRLVRGMLSHEIRGPTQMRRFSMFLTVAATLAASAGCSRQDADALARIGQLLNQKAKSLRETSNQNRTIPGYLNSNGANRAENETEPAK
jgi:hypothetical protein